MTLPPEIAAWRKAERSRLLALRSGALPQQRRHWSDAITHHLLHGFAMPAPTVVSFYWPFKGEFDPRFAIRAWRSHGVRAALPVVQEKHAPLQFRQWWPGVRTSAGAYGLPMPVASAVLLPDVALIPPIGFDAMGYRLGYGGGYFDRTLAALSPQPLKIGVAFELSRIGTIRPQAHDIAMDFIVTQAGIHHVATNGLRLVSNAGEVQDLAAVIAGQRGLPRQTPG